jgi:hypothetical protein
MPKRSRPQCLASSTEDWTTRGNSPRHKVGNDRARFGAGESATNSTGLMSSDPRSTVLCGAAKRYINDLRPPGGAFE